MIKPKSVLVAQVIVTTLFVGLAIFSWQLVSVISGMVMVGWAIATLLDWYVSH